MLKYINFPAFIISLCVGFVYVYLSKLETETIVVYPTPENSGKIEYKDRAGNCFVFKSRKVKCPKTGTKIFLFRNKYIIIIYYVS